MLSTVDSKNLLGLPYHITLEYMIPSIVESKKNVYTYKIQCSVEYIMLSTVDSKTYYHITLQDVIYIRGDRDPLDTF